VKRFVGRNKKKWRWKM